MMLDSRTPLKWDEDTTQKFSEEIVLLKLWYMMNIMQFAPKQEGADGWSSSLIFCQLKEGIKEVVIFHDFFR